MLSRGSTAQGRSHNVRNIIATIFCLPGSFGVFDEPMAVGAFNWFNRSRS
jgi:hypothetical protein